MRWPGCASNCQLESMGKDKAKEERTAAGPASDTAKDRWRACTAEGEAGEVPGDSEDELPTSPLRDGRGGSYNYPSVKEDLIWIADGRHASLTGDTRAGSVPMRAIRRTGGRGSERGRPSEWKNARRTPRRIHP